MKYMKLFLTSLVGTLLVANSVYADAKNSHDILPNKIPETIQFNPAQPGGDKATLFFPNSSLPAKFLCYFAANNNQQLKGISARITSEKDKIDFMGNSNDNLMEAGKNDVKMFAVTAAIGSDKIGRVDITLEGDKSALQAKMITMICTMRK